MKWQFLFLLTVVSALEVLVYQPLLMPSHVKFMTRLVDVLVDAGHNVTVIVSEHRPDVAHGCERAKELIFITPPESVITEIPPDLGWITHQTPASQWKAMRPLAIPLGKQCKNLLKDSSILGLQDRHFDVFIHEVFDMCGLALTHVLNVPKHVIVSSTRQMDTVAYELGLLAPHRDGGILSDYGSHLPWTGFFRNAEFIRSFLKFTDIQPDYYMKELKTLNFTGILRHSVRSASAVFLNTHPLADTWRPSLRNVYDIGGIGLQRTAPLNSDLKSTLSRWEKVVFISFGTVVPSAYMPQAWKANLRNVIRAFPDTLFLWKYEENDAFLSENMSNVVFSPFFPQNNLLGSGFISLFITHGGQNSVLEAANVGVPMLVIPQFGDQFRNAKAVEERQLGKIMDKKELGNFNVLKKNIEQMLFHKNESLKKVSGAICVEAASREFVFRLESVVHSPLTFEEGPQPTDVLALLDRGWAVVCTLAILATAPLAAAFLRHTPCLLRKHLSNPEKAQHQ